VVELRHNSWDEQSEEINALLEANRAGSVLIDEPKFSSSIRQGLDNLWRIFLLPRSRPQRQGLVEAEGNVGRL
jgi:hypothetical protein